MDEVGLSRRSLTGVVTRWRVFLLLGLLLLLLVRYSAENREEATLSTYTTDGYDLFLYPQHQQKQLTTVLDQYARFPVEEIWKLNSRMSRARPLLVFDQRKAYSAALRGALHRAAERLRISTFIPCYDSLPCTAREFPRSARAVYAYHMYWGEQNNLERFPYGHRTKFSCVTNFIEPVERVKTCICAKLAHVLKQLKTPRLSQLTAEQLLTVLVEGVDSYGVSCLNEPFRVFSGIHDEETLTNLGFIYHAQNRTVEHHLSAMSIELFLLTLRHIQRCAPIDMSNRESVMLMHYKYPLLYNHSAFDFTTAASRGSAVAGGSSEAPKACARESLPTVLQEVLLNVTALERILFQAVKSKIKKAVHELNVTAAPTPEVFT